MFCTSAKEDTANRATFVDYQTNQNQLCGCCVRGGGGKCSTFGRVGASNDTPVTTPSVPSAPINNCFRSYPVLSFLMPCKVSMIDPSGSTTPRPKTLPFRLPYRRYRMPPAFVETFPPIWQLFRNTLGLNQMGMIVTCP